MTTTDEGNLMNALGLSHVDMEPPYTSDEVRWQSDGESQPSMKMESFVKITPVTSKSDDCGMKTDDTTEGSSSDELLWQSDGESQPSMKMGNFVNVAPVTSKSDDCAIKTDYTTEGSSSHDLRWQSDGESQPSVKMGNFVNITPVTSKSDDCGMKTDYTTEGSTSMDDEDVLMGSKEESSSEMDTTSSASAVLSSKQSLQSELEADDVSHQEHRQHVFLEDDQSKDDLSVILMAKKFLGYLNSNANGSKSHCVDEEQGQCGFITVKSMPIALDANDPPSVGDPSVGDDNGIARKSRNQILPLTLENVDYIASMEEATHSNSLSTMHHNIPEDIARQVFTKTIPCEIAQHDIAEEVSTLYAPSAIFDDTSMANKSKKSSAERSQETARADNRSHPVEGKTLNKSASITTVQRKCGDRNGLEIFFIILMITSAVTLLSLVLYITLID